MLPLCERYGVDAYIMAGEISDTRLHDMAEVGAEDGRPMVVLTLSDADPAGYWMPSTIAWKLGALRDGWYPELKFEVHPLGFLPEQVIAINETDEPLPSSPLKEGEKRGGAWYQTFGIEQVEVDAIATLRPNVLADIVRAGIEQFYDKTLNRRVAEVKQAYEAEAQPKLEQQLGPGEIERMRTETQTKMDDLRERVEDLRDELWLDTTGFDLPPIPEIPAPELNGVPSPLAASWMEYAEFVDRIKARGAYAKSK